MDKSELNEWAAAYIKAHEAPENKAQLKENFWAVQKFFDLEHEHPEQCWQAILEILHRKPNDSVVGVLAAGPLEELIEKHGESFINKIEEEARKKQEFRHLLGGVWESSTPEIWNRVLKARNNMSW